MGCFNTTCGVTGLPITYGDKIRAFIVKKNQELREQAVYSHDYAQPLAVET